MYLDGDLDAAFLVWARNIREFEEVYDEINQKYGVYFQERYFSIATKIEYLKYKFLNNSNDPSALVFGDCYSEVELDMLDQKILNELNVNGRITLLELANRYNSSAKVIKERIARLMRNKIIIGFNVRLDHNLIGYTHRKVFLKLNDSSKEKLSRLSAYLRSQSSVIYLTKPIGDYDFEF